VGAALDDPTVVHHRIWPAPRRVERPGTTSHHLRHHFASLLLAAGESVIAVAERPGRDDAALVLSTCGHLMPDSEDRTASG